MVEIEIVFDVDVFVFNMAVTMGSDYTRLTFSNMKHENNSHLVNDSGWHH